MLRRTGWPPTATEPVAFASAPKIACRISLRPEPRRPANPTISPGRIARSAPAIRPGDDRPLTVRAGSVCSAGGDRSTWPNAVSRPTMAVIKFCSSMAARGSFRTVTPSRSTVTFWQSSSTSSRKCEMNRIDVPCVSRSRRMVSNTKARSVSDSEAVGSSMINRRACAASACRIETIWRRPIGSSSTMVSGSMS